MKFRVLSGPFHETLKLSPATAVAGPVSVPVIPVTVTVARASVRYCWPVAYRSSYAPGTSGAVKVRVAPRFVYS